MSTKIHATVDALGNPTGFHLTPGQAHDLEGAEALVPALEADMLIADKVQNMKDFITYHYKKHKRSDELMGYFNKWLDALDVSTETYHSLCKQITKNTQ